MYSTAMITGEALAIYGTELADKGEDTPFATVLSGGFDDQLEAMSSRVRLIMSYEMTQSRVSPP